MQSNLFAHFKLEEKVIDDLDGGSSKVGKRGRKPQKSGLNNVIGCRSD